MGSENFEKVRAFIKTFVDNFDIGPGSVRIGVTTFNSAPQNEFWLNEYTNKTALLEAIDQIQYTGGATYTAEALQFIRENAFTSVSLRRNMCLLCSTFF